MWCGLCSHDVAVLYKRVQNRGALECLQRGIGLALRKTALRNYNVRVEARVEDGGVVVYFWVSMLAVAQGLRPVEGVLIREVILTCCGE